MSRRLPPATRVLVTRPIEQSAALVKLIVDAGGEPVVAPMIRIEATQNPLDLAALDALGKTQSTAVFLSANSVRHAITPTAPLAIAAKIVAMGDATATALGKLGYVVSATPVGGIDSEALLAHPLMHNPRGRKFIVFQGEGGRGVVQQALKDAGADLHTHVCYRRISPDLTGEDFAAVWRAKRPDRCIISSATALENLLELAGDHRAEVLAAGFVVMGQRLARLATEAGVTGQISVARVASDEGLLAALFDASD